MKTISMTYQEYLNEIEEAKNEIDLKWRSQISELTKIDVKMDFSLNVPVARYVFKGSTEELLDALRKIEGQETLKEFQRRI